MANRIELPKDRELAGKLLQSHADVEAAKMQRGLVGAVIGMGEEKPGNIGVLAFVMAGALFLIVFFAPSTAELPKKEALLTFAGIMTTALGFVFGRATA